METVHVFVRFRAEEGETAAWVLTDMTVTGTADGHKYSFDRVFGREIGQSDVFDVAARDLLNAL